MATMAAALPDPHTTCRYCGRKNKLAGLAACDTCMPIHIARLREKRADRDAREAKRAELRATRQERVNGWLNQEFV
jgi:hypothetical protein